MSCHQLISSFVVTLIVATSAASGPADVATGSFPEGELYVPPAEHAPAHLSRTQVQTIDLTGGRAVVGVHARGEGRLLIWILPLSAQQGVMSKGQAGPAVSCSVSSPAGRTSLDEDGKGDELIRELTMSIDELGLGLPEAQKAYEVTKAEAGVYRLEIRGDLAAVMVVSAEPQSTLTLETWAGPLSRRPGEPVVLHGELHDGPAALSDARVSARLAAPGKTGGDAIDLFDDGAHGDGRPGDGIYATTIETLPDGPSGFWTVRFEAEGSDIQGIPYARTGGGGFVNEPDAARLIKSAISTRFVEDGGETLLRVEAGVLVKQAGLYRLDTIVVGAPESNGSRRALAWGEGTRRLVPGHARFVIEIPADQINAAAGDALSLDIRLVGLDPLCVAGRWEMGVGN